MIERDQRVVGAVEHEAGNGQGRQVIRERGWDGMHRRDMHVGDTGIAGDADGELSTKNSPSAGRRQNSSGQNAACAPAPEMNRAEGCPRTPKPLTPETNPRLEAVDKGENGQPCPLL